MGRGPDVENKVRELIRRSHLDPAGDLQVTAAHGADGGRESAAIWAHARACRDQDPEPATVEDTMPGIRRRLSIDGATLLLARRNGHPVGFALVAPGARTLEAFIRESA